MSCLPEPAKHESLSQQLISYLHQATTNLKQGDLLRIPPDISNGFLRSSDAISENELSTLITLIDSDPKKGNCSRFDLLSFQCMLVVLLRAPPCLARERGGFLFLESMRELSHMLKHAVDSEFAVAARRRKGAISQRTCRLFLQTLVAGNNALPRRWSGQFLYELIRDCEENQKQLSSITELTWQIGGIVVRDSDYPLRFISANIIRLLALAQFDLSTFWPANTDEKWLARFSSRPSSSYHDWASQLSQVLRQPGPADRGAAIFTLASLDGPKCTMDLRSCVSTLIVSDHLIFLIAGETRFQVLDVAIESFMCIRQMHDDPVVLQIVPHHEGQYTVDGVARSLERLIIRAREINQAAAIVSAIAKLKDALASGPDERIRHGVSTFVAAWNDEYPTPNETALIVGKCQIAEATPAKGRRGISSAIIELPDADEVLLESRRYLAQKREVSCPQVDAGSSTPQQLQLEDIVDLDSEASYHSRTPSAGSPLQVRDGDKDHILDSVDNLEVSKEELRQSAASHISKNPAGEREVLKETRDAADELHVDRAADHQQDLPDLAQEALQLHLLTVDVPTTSPNDAPEPPDSGEDTHVADTAEKFDSCVTRISDSQPFEASKIDATRDMASGVGGKPAAVTEGNNHPPNVHTNTISTTANSRLKRPFHKVAELSTALENVDWDQDLRVSDGGGLISKSVSPAMAKKQKRMPENEEASVPPKARKQSSSATKRTPQLPLPITPSLNSTAPKQRVRRQVTKTLTSSRKRRVAATEASKRMAAAAEEEDEDDLGDPIETDSSAVAPQITESAADGVVLEPQHALTITTRGDTPSPAAAAVQGSEDGGPDRDKSTSTVAISPQGPSTKSRPLTAGKPSQNHAPTGSVSDDIGNKVIQSEARDELKEQPCTDHELKSKLRAVQKQTLAKKLASTLASAGIIQGKELSGNSPKVTKGIAKAENISQVSKNVSDFMSRKVEAPNRLRAPAKKPIPSLPSTSASDQDDASLTVDIEDATHIVPNPGSPANAKMHRPTGNCSNAREIETKARTPKVQFQVSDEASTSVEVEDVDEIEESSEAKSNPLGLKLQEPDYSRTMGSVSLTDDQDDRDDGTDVILISAESEISTDESPSHQLVPPSTSELISSDSFEGKIPEKKVFCQSQTVDENGSPKPRKPMARNSQSIYRNHQVGRSPTGRKVVSVASPPSDREAQELAGLCNRGVSRIDNRSICKKKGMRQERENQNIGSAKGIDSIVFPSHGKQRIVDNSTIYHPFRRTMAMEKHKTSRKPTFAERLRASREWPYPQKCVGRRGNLIRPVEAREKDRNEIDNQLSEDIVSDGDTTIEEDIQSSSTPDWATGGGRQDRPMWQRLSNTSAQADMDIMLETTKRLMGKLVREERHMFKVVDIYQKGGDKLLDQLEKVHSQQVEKCADNLQPLKEKLIELCNETSKQLDADHRSLQASRSLKDMSSNLTKKRRKLLDQLDAMNANLDDELSRLQG